jgi:beta-galactosidase
MSPTVPFRTDRILHGGDYNPDQWPEHVQDEDIALMRRAGVNLVTLPVFGWAALNPAEGVFTFEWLDRVLARLDAAGIGYSLATATAATPAWLDQKYPDALVTDDHGRVRPHGNRHFFCPQSSNHRRLAETLVRRLAARYAGRRGLRLWHVGNEYAGNRAPFCHCPRCATAFRDWLRDRHGDLATLNTRWTTSAWGHVFTDWTQIEPPFAHGEQSIPALRLDWKRFQNEALLDRFLGEVSVLREFTPSVPLTTNFMGTFGTLDYRRWAPHLDVVSWDSYPQPGEPHELIAFRHALMRGLRPGRPFLLMEQTPSAVNWADLCRPRPAGELRRQSLQAVARGSDAVLYFQWRAAPGGIEKYHGAVLEHHGRADSRVFREVAALGSELAALGNATVGGEVPARIALVFEWETWWEHQVTLGPRRDLDYPAEVARVFTALERKGLASEIVGIDADLAPYDLIILPMTTLLDERQAARIEARVRAGATLLATTFTARVDAHGRVHQGGAPGPLRDLLGVTVEEFEAVPAAETHPVRFLVPCGPDIAGGRTLAGDFLRERLWLHDARAIAVFDDAFFQNAASLTLREHGEGRAHYLATRLGPEDLGALLTHLCQRHGISSPLRDGAPPPSGVEITIRRPTRGGELLFGINHSGQTHVLPLPEGAHLELLSGTTVSGTVPLPAGESVIVALAVGKHQHTGRQAAHGGPRDALDC